MDTVDSQAIKESLKAVKNEMKKTARYVAEKRQEWGEAHVKDMQRRAMRGERGCFYAVEKVAPDTYKTFGTPFDWSGPDTELLSRCMVLGIEFAGMMQPPAGAVHASAAAGQGVDHGTA